MASRSTKSRRTEQAPAWVWMLFGLGLGLVVALGVYLRGSSPSAPRGETVAVRPAAPAPAARPPRAAPPPESAEQRFAFYDMLPRQEVVVPEVETATGREVQAKPVEEPGRYVLQAGSFTSAPDADRLQASLALLGVESRIQRVTIDDAIFHRVRVGPISNLNDLNRIRRQLREARIEPMLLKVP